MNGIENPNRQDGIDIAFDKKKVKGKVLFPALVEDPKRFNFKKHDFTQEAEHDPNQSWYQEEEYDGDYEEYDESLVNEGRSINKIQKEWSETTTKMQQKAGEWKVAEGDRKSELLDEMKALTAKKRELEAELDSAVAGKDKDLELVVSEGNAFGAARAKAIADGVKEFEFEGETYKVEDVGPDDKENAEEFVEESKLTLDALVEMFEVKVNEDLRSDVKKFIKDNASELNTLADKDEWDLMYAKLYNEFNVEADSTKGKDLLKTFQFVF
jgi:hypothetical protein